MRASGMVIGASTRGTGTANMSGDLMTERDLVGEPEPEPEPAAPPPLRVAEAVAAGRHWRLATAHGPVHVWIPVGYDRATALTIIYVHGYFTDVDGAWNDHQLPAQFALSGVNAMFVAIEAPFTYGKPVVWESLSDVLDAVEAGTGQPLPRGRVAAVGHSAAFRTLTSWLADPMLDTLVLFDAAYETPQFIAWINASPDHRLIDVGDDTRPWTEAMHRALPETVLVDHVPAPDEVVPTDAHILYIQSDVGHMPLVTGGVALPIVLRALTSERVPGAPAWEPI